MKLRWIATTFVLAVAVAACGGGGGGGSVAPITPGGGGITTASTPVPTSPASSQPVSTATGGSSKVTMSILIPKATTSSSSARSSKYIPSNTASLTMQLLSVNGTAQSGSVQGPFNLTAPTQTSPNPNCQVVSNGTKCSFQIDAPIGNDVFVANSFAQANGVNPLGSGSVAITVQSNATNTTGLTLSGPVASVSVVSGIYALNNGNPAYQPTSIPTQAGVSVGRSPAGQRAPLLSSTPTPTPVPTPAIITSARMYVIALDAQGNQIINPTTFDIPITLQLNLNGAPANVVQLKAVYAGLSANDNGSATTATDGGTVTIYAPSDQVTINLIGSLPSASISYLNTTVTAAYTPQGGTPQTSSPLFFYVDANPPGPYYTIAQNYPSPFPQPSGTMTISVGNTGTAATAPLTVVGSLLYGGINNFATTNTGFWSCSITASSGSYSASYTCTSVGNQALAPQATAPPIVLTVAPYYYGYFYSNATVNNTASSFANVTVGPSPTPTPTYALNVSISPYSTPFYTSLSGIFTETITNSGAAATSGTLTLTTTLPPNVQITATGGGWTCPAPSGSLGAGYTQVCTSTTPIPAGGNNSLTLTVVPQPAIADSTLAATASISSGNTANASVSVLSPIQFTTTSYAALPTPPASFKPGDQAVMDFGVPPSVPANQTVSITPLYNYTGLYTLVSDTCTSASITDSQFANSLAPISMPSANPAQGTNIGVPFPINVTATGNAGPCSVKIQDASGNPATLTIQVETTSLTVQGKKRR